MSKTNLTNILNKLHLADRCLDSEYKNYKWENMVAKISTSIGRNICDQTSEGETDTTNSYQK